ncbi:Uncharacterised protein [Mycobacteroides abscessus subsp. abscessus]|nr:Uncharacterised protein [Mycobacteroides abscessus subsp. abscessus]
MSPRTVSRWNALPPRLSRSWPDTECEAIARFPRISRNSFTLGAAERERAPTRRWTPFRESGY